MASDEEQTAEMAQAAETGESPEAPQSTGAESVLSEGEIDALMESVDDSDFSADAGDDGQHRRFDFGAREHSILRNFTVFDSVLERHAELLAKALDRTFSIEFLVRANPPSLVSVADTLASLERVIGVTTSTLKPLPGPAFALATAETLSFVVNAYFGGGAVTSEESDAKSSLTPSELRMAERLADLQFGLLTEAWDEKVQLQVEDQNTLGVPDRLEMVPRDDLLLRLGFHLHAGEHESELVLLMPFLDLEPYRERFSPPKQKDSDLVETWEAFFRRELPYIEVEVAGVLNDTRMPLGEVMELERGTVIAIQPPEEVALRVDEVTVARGRYGSLKGSKAVDVQELSGLLRPRRRSGER
ncbi:MAG: FliM/FliN family flagellar motor switch protein [Pseudomonadota bacterium]